MSSAQVIAVEEQDDDAVVTLLCRLIASLEASDLCDGWLDILVQGDIVGACAGTNVRYASEALGVGCEPPLQPPTLCRFAAVAVGSGSFMNFAMYTLGS